MERKQSKTVSSNYQYQTTTQREEAPTRTTTIKQGVPVTYQREVSPAYFVNSQRVVQGTPAIRQSFRKSFTETGSTQPSSQRVIVENGVTQKTKNIESQGSVESISNANTNTNILNEVIKTLNSLKDKKGDQQMKSLLTQIEKLSQENTSLRSQVEKLQLQINDELLILEKVETKEVYGKKSKVQEELEAGKQIKVEYEKLKTIIIERDNKINDLKTTVDHLRREKGTTQTRIEVRYESPPELLQDLKNKNYKISKLEQEIANLSSRSSKIEVVEKFVIPNDINNELTSLREFHRKHTQLKNENDTNIRFLQDKIHKLENAHNQELLASKHQLQIKNNALNELESKLKSLEISLKNEREANNNLQKRNTVSSSLSNSQEEAYSRMIDSLQHEISNLKRELLASKDYQQQNQNLKASNAKLATNIAHLEEELKIFKAQPKVTEKSKDYDSAFADLREALRKLASSQNNTSTTTVKEIYESKASDLTSILEKILGAAKQDNINSTDYLKMQGELTEVKLKLDERNARLKEADDKLKQLQNELVAAKARKSEYKSRFESITRERENSRRDTDTVSKFSVADEPTRGSSVELSKVTAELAAVKAELQNHKNSIVKRKRALLAELSNFVDSKNNFEKNLFSEPSTASTADIDISNFN